MKSIKTFKDLKFEMHPTFTYATPRGTKSIYPEAKRAVMEFENGYGVSVILGELFYSNGVDTYEVAILKNGKICYDTYITNDVLGYQNKGEVTEIMRKVQGFNK